MKLIITGDKHLTDKKPENRKDNWWITVLGKEKFILDTAKKKIADAIICPGDLTDTPFMSWGEFTDIVKLYHSSLSCPLFCVFGQHDMRYRTKPETALSALNAAIPQMVLLDNTFSVMNDLSTEGRICIKGCSYNSEIPEPDPDASFNILIIHKMIIDTKLWSKQEDYEPSNIFLRRHKFDLIISGDNHQSFIESVKGAKAQRYLFNLGAMLRNKIDMANHKPFIVFFDTETREYEKIMIPIAPADSVFSLENAEKEKSRDEKLEAFVSGLSDIKHISLCFQDNLRNYIDQNGIDPGIATIAFNSLDERIKK